MKTWMKMLIVAVVLAIISVPLGQILWPPASGGLAGAPMGGELALLILLSIYEGLSFGLGVAFLIFGLPLVRRANLGAAALTWATFLSIAWLMISWWPHDGFHRSVTTFQGLLMIEYGFHITLMTAGAILALAFYRLVRGAVATPGRVAPRTGAAYETAAG